jgi:hypothetical protein
VEWYSSGSICTDKGFEERQHPYIISALAMVRSEEWEQNMPKRPNIYKQVKPTQLQLKGPKRLDPEQPLNVLRQFLVDLVYRYEDSEERLTSCKIRGLLFYMRTIDRKECGFYPDKRAKVSKKETFSIFS